MRHTPAPATRSRQTIFLFNGIQNTGANFGILQPVLQYGSSAAGGGAFWSIASWYVTSGGQAELGRALGGYVNVITKSGTNLFHGDVYDYMRDDRFNARNFYSLKSRRVVKLPT